MSKEKEMIDAIGALKAVCRTDFVITLSGVDFNALCIYCDSIARNPPPSARLYRFPYMKVHGMTVKNADYFKDIQKEINKMIDYIANDI